MDYFVWFLLMIFLTVGLVGLFYKSKTKQEEPEQVVPSNIGEPVVSFVELVKRNPKRFKFIKTYSDSNDRVTIYEVNDTLLKETHTVRIICDNFGFHRTVRVSIEGKDYLTIRELDYLYENLSDFYDKRSARYYDIKRLRRQRVMKKQEELVMIRKQKQREADIKKYCKEEK